MKTDFLPTGMIAAKANSAGLTPFEYPNNFPLTQKWSEKTGTYLPYQQTQYTGFGRV